jgi:hypothetical protein
MMHILSYAQLKMIGARGLNTFNVLLAATNIRLSVKAKFVSLRAIVL